MSETQRPRFDADVNARYFPEFKRELPHYLRLSADALKESRRHCDRSEAIEEPLRFLDCFVAARLAMTIRTFLEAARGESRLCDSN